MLILSRAILVVGLILIPSAVGVARLEHDRQVAEVERTLFAEIDARTAGLRSYFAGGRSSVLLTANSPAFAAVVEEPGARAQKVRRQSLALRQATQQLGFLEQLYPQSIGEACLIDVTGAELARVVRGEIAPPEDLSTTEQNTTFFAPTFALRFGEVHQPKPYTSDDTKEWVIANATLVPSADGAKRAIAHFEVTIESFRREMRATKDYDLRIVDRRTGAVVIDGARPQRIGAPLGVPGDRRFLGLRGVAAQGTLEIDGRRAAYHRIPPTMGNANDWIVVARATRPVGGLAGGFGAATLVIVLVALAMIALGAMSLRAARRTLELQAATDALTGLGNPRQLTTDLERGVRAASSAQPLLLTLFDLNGFKNYNDVFGHLAGDVLLQRLGRALADAVAPYGGRAYRPGGDEFCVLAGAASRRAIEQAAAAALSERGDGFAISTAFGSVVVPRDTGDAGEAMRKADQAMYAQKQSGRATAGRQSSNVLLRALAERHPDLGDHQNGVAELAEQVGARIGIQGDELADLRQAAALHDIGKVAIPDAILHKPGPLSDEEWTFMRRHTIIGERILLAAPSLGGAATLVRSSHEAWDGAGYPDALVGVEIPIGARIIAICDAFDAMISTRPYSRSRTSDEALDELRRCAGAQFDPELVPVFERVLADRALRPAPAGAA